MIVDRRLSQARFEREVRPLLEAADVLTKVGRRIVGCEFPVLDVELWWDAVGSPIYLRIDATDYDYLPVRGWWVDDAGQLLTGGARRVPVGHGFQRDPNPYGEPRPWFCFPGWREYHDHPGHQDIPWAAIRLRPRFRLPGLIHQLHIDLNHTIAARRPVPA